MHFNAKILYSQQGEKQTTKSLLRILRFNWINLIFNVLALIANLKDKKLFLC